MYGVLFYHPIGLNQIRLVGAKRKPFGECRKRNGNFDVMDKLIALIIMLFREPKYQPLRYLGVGAWNTFFGAFVYATLHYFFNTRVHYLVLIIPANIFAITNAFLCYKYIVFQTDGRGWHEYFKCYLVYGWIALLNAGLLYVLVEFVHFHPSIANCFCILTATTISYFSHKHFSFGRRK